MVAARRLSRALLDTIRAERPTLIDAPSDDVLELPERAVQFGTGAFLRGFVDDFLHRANQRGLFGGRVVAIGSMGGTRSRSLREQDGLFTLVVEGVEHGEHVQEIRVIGSLSRALSALDEWDEVLALARSPQLEFVFSNATEVGVVLSETDRYDDAPPSTFPAKLTRFLHERWVSGASGVTVIPCELIENNGDRLREIVLLLASRWKLDETFSRWITESVPFCNTLVDRIVPGAPRDARVDARLGYSDALVTCCEPYRLFAIEGDEAIRARLTWASVDPGIIIAPSIAPFRKRKVHLLNGTHTLLVSVALPMGCETVLDAMSQPALGRFVRHVMLDEIAPTLHVNGAEEFAEAVLDRFRNPFIQHSLLDIAFQATMKMRVRVVPTIQRSMASSMRVPQCLAFGFAAFLLFMQGRFHSSRLAQGLSVPVDDQGARLHSLWTGIPDDPAAPVGELVWAACRDVSLWGADLTTLPGFCEAAADHLWRARAHGVGAALEHHLSTAVS